MGTTPRSEALTIDAAAAAAAAAAPPPPPPAPTTGRFITMCFACGGTASAASPVAPTVRGTACPPIVPGRFAMIAVT
jgi:hypothetical protein